MMTDADEALRREIKELRVLRNGQLKCLSLNL